MLENDNKLLWSPSKDQIESSSMFLFMKMVNKKYKLKLKNFRDLHHWSVDKREDFWSEVWDFYELIGEKGSTPYLLPDNKMPGSKFFPEGKISYAENILKKHDRETAIIFQSENKIFKTMSWKDLYTQVASTADFFSSIGIKKGDRVAAYLPNIPETIVVMLAATSLGAIFSSASPDFGSDGVLDRFGQIKPKLLITTDGYNYNGKEIKIKNKVEQIVKGLPSIEAILMIPLIQSNEIYNDHKTYLFNKVLEDHQNKNLRFERLSLNDPLYIMYSSGTTGKPKCIVHSVGGVILKHLVELGLHFNAKLNYRIFYFTTCGWMMWNWLVSGLLFGSTICLYDGSPFYPNWQVLWDYTDKNKINFFGTSAKYIDALSKEKLKIIDRYELLELETIGSTGSTLVHESFDYIYQNIKKNVHLASLSGGTDIVGCFVGGNPFSSVYRGEIQGPILGMDVHVFDDNGLSVINKQGELVCVKSFPTMPIKFWQDEDGSKYHNAYFNKYKGIWCHGDYILKTTNNGFIIYGRSDATLNPGGVRIGTSEIYRQVEQFEEVLEAIVVGQNWQGDTRLVLFVRLNDKTTLNETLILKIKKKIKEGASPRHVPAKIIKVDDIPRTKSGKIAELAVRDLIHNKEVKNQTALANAECLEFYRNLSELRT